MPELQTLEYVQQKVRDSRKAVTVMKSRIDGMQGTFERRRKAQGTLESATRILQEWEEAEKRLVGRPRRARVMYTNRHDVCPSCGALPGDSCRYPSGFHFSKGHKDRR